MLPGCVCITRGWFTFPYVNTDVQSRLPTQTRRRVFSSKTSSVEFTFEGRCTCGEPTWCVCLREVGPAAQVALCTVCLGRPPAGLPAVIGGFTLEQVKPEQLLLAHL